MSHGRRMSANFYTARVLRQLRKQEHHYVHELFLQSDWVSQVCFVALPGLQLLRPLHYAAGSLPEIFMDYYHAHTMVPTVRDDLRCSKPLKLYFTLSIMGLHGYSVI